VSLFPAPQRANHEIDNVSIGYVIATSEPTDSHVSLSKQQKSKEKIFY